MDRMNEDLSKINWQPIYNCKNVCNALNSCSNLKNIFDQHTPFIAKRVRGKKRLWLTSEIRRKMLDCDNLTRKARKNKRTTVGMPIKDFEIKVQTRFVMQSQDSTGIY